MNGSRVFVRGAFPFFQFVDADPNLNHLDIVPIAMDMVSTPLNGNPLSPDDLDWLRSLVLVRCTKSVVVF